MVAQSARWVVGVAALLALCGCSPTPKSQPSVPQAPPAPQTNPLLDLLKPVEPSPAGDFVAAGLEGVVLYDRSGASKVVAAQGKRVRGLYWSPKRRWLLANTEGPAVWLIDPAKGTATDLTRQLPGLHDGKLSVSWSPDESQALVADGLLGTDPSTIWLMTPATGSARKLTEAAKLGEVRWLVGGKGVLMVGAGCCGPMNMVIRLDDGRYIQGAEFDGGGSYSPDGRLFVPAPYMGASLTIREMVTGTSRVVWRDLPPGDQPPAEGIQYKMFAGLWSSDSRLIAFGIEAWDRQKRVSSTLRVVDVTDGSQVRLVRDWAGAVQWLPLGQGLLYTTRKGQELAVHLEDRILSTHPAGDVDPSWGRGVVSPDGRLLAYTVTYSGKSSELFVVKLENGEVRTVPDSAGLLPLMWATDGTQLLVAQSPALPGEGEIVGIQWIRP